MRPPCAFTHISNETLYFFFNKQVWSSEKATCANLQEAVEKLISLRKLDSDDARMKAWRALLREWHPDKNPERVEVATAVFQLLHSVCTGL